MTDQEARNLFMDYLYDEMDAKQKKDFEKQLEENPELQKEFEELQSTRNLLQFVPMETPPHKLVMMAPESSETSKPENDSSSNRSAVQGIFKRYPGFATVFAAVASLLIILFGAAFVDLQMGQTDEGFYVSFGERLAGEQQPEPDGVSEQEVYNLMEQIRRENSLLLTSMVEQLQEQQNERLEEAINTLTTYYDQRRQQDLMLISEGLAQLEEDTYNRLRRTDQTLGDLIYALSYQSTQSTQE